MRIDDTNCIPGEKCVWDIDLLKIKIVISISVLSLRTAGYKIWTYKTQSCSLKLPCPTKQFEKQTKNPLLFTQSKSCYVRSFIDLRIAVLLRTDSLQLSLHSVIIWTKCTFCMWRRSMCTKQTTKLAPPCRFSSLVPANIHLHYSLPSAITNNTNDIDRRAGVSNIWPAGRFRPTNRSNSVGEIFFWSINISRGQLTN